MSTSDSRRPTQPRQPRPRREPLFPLEAEDIAPRTRRGPPAPLRDLVGDLDAQLPTRVDGPRRESHTPGPPPERPAQRQPEPQKPQARPAARVDLDTRATARPRSRPMVAAEQEREIFVAQARHDDTRAMLYQAERLAARPYRSYAPAHAPQLPGLNTWLMLSVVALASLVVLFGLGGGGVANLSRWGALLKIATNEESTTNRLQLFGAARVAGDYHLQGAPSVTAQQIDAILAAYGSPAAGTGADWYNLGLKYGIDPAYAVAFFIHESSAGTHPAWAGLKPDGASTHNVGNIICAGYASCYGRFRDYGSWDEGIEDWYRLIDVEYIKGRGTLTVQDIIPIYAPSFENDVQAYINSVTDMVDGWRTNGVN